MKIKSKQATKPKNEVEVPTSGLAVLKALPMDERNQLMKTLRASDRTLDEIGRMFDVSRARVLQIVGARTSTKRQVTERTVHEVIATFFAEYGVYPSLRMLADLADISGSYARMMLQQLAQQGKVTIAVVKGRIYISDVVPPANIPPEMRAKVVEGLKAKQREWAKK